MPCPPTDGPLPAPPSPPPLTAMPAGRVVVLLAMLLGIQPVTTDLYLPGLPALTSGFAASMAQAQLTLTALLLAFGLSQLVWGTLSDRFGRRPILLWGLGAYVLASVACVLAPSMATLIVWRAVQGAAMGASVMCARAIVRDLYAPEDGARVMSRGLTGLGLIACLSAPAGSLLSEYFGWRAALATLAVFGAATLLLVALWLRETAPPPRPGAVRPAALLATWRGILRHPTFWAFSLLTVSTYGGLFTFLAASSFVLLDVLGLSRLQYGGVMFGVSLVYIAGTFLCRHWLARFGLQRTVARGALLSLGGGTAMGVLALAGVHHPLALVLPFCLFAVGHGIHQPCGQIGAVGPFPHAAGTASALNGCLMMLAAFAMGGWIGTRLDGTVFALSNGLWFWGVCVALAAWGLVPRYGRMVAVKVAQP